MSPVERAAGRRILTAVVTAARLGAAVVAVARLARAGRRVPPVRRVVDARSTAGALGTISVIVPARDEEARIAPLLAAVVGAPGVDEVVVVDDGSTDGTAAVATAAGARVVAAGALPPGWAGKAWALQRGIESVGSEWVVTLDADTRPAPELPHALVVRAAGDRVDLLTVGGRFECPTPGAQWLNPALLTTLVYRFGPPGSAAASGADRLMANGQCMVLRRAPFLAAGAMAPVRAHPVEDVALARHLAAQGWSVAFLDASDLLSVRMFESLADTWRGWGRSIALPGVEPPRRQLLDLAVLLATMAAPVPRIVARRGDVLDAVLVALRVGTLVGTRRAYRARSAAYWLSPLADPLAVAALALGIVRRRQTWRGREYATPTPPARTAAR